MIKMAKRLERFSDKSMEGTGTFRRLLRRAMKMLPHHFSRWFNRFEVLMHMHVSQVGSGLGVYPCVARICVFVCAYV